MLRKLLSLALLFVTSTLHAESGRSDYDLDEDGLIEINDLQDLDEIRNHLDGTALYGSADGCPVDGCVGFELTTDLNFDTNGDGILDEADNYWNNGQGWNSIGVTGGTFEAVFDGNHHAISNLMINRPYGGGYQGLFGRVKNATLRNLGLRGHLMSITGVNYNGGLTALAENSMITEVYSTGAITSAGSGTDFTGGLIGIATNTIVSHSFSTGKVSGNGQYDAVGGLVARVQSSSIIRDCFATGEVLELGTAGSLVGTSHSSELLRNISIGAGIMPKMLGSNGLGNDHASNYWWTTEGAPQVEGVGIGASLRELQCPTGAENTDCNAVILFAGWGEARTSEGDLIWDFGTANQLPGMRINGEVYRDSDGDGWLDRDDTDDDNDGVLDADDAFPADATETTDSDSDGVGDNSDAFPADASETVDTDGDGTGDNSDAFPADPLESADTDGDGMGDNSDAFPADATETVDTDGDGTGDNLDTFPTDPSESADIDGDGVGDNADAFPSDPLEAVDTDSDGVGDNTDTFPTDPSESADIDGDGVGDNADAFPSDSAETVDTDSDGVGDNTDTFPSDATETADTDGDGTGDNADAFPENPSESLDTDGDGIGNNTDIDDDNDGVADENDPELGPDNGLPVILAVPDSIIVFENGQPLAVTLLTSEVAVSDVVDSAPVILANLNGEPVALDGDTKMAVPCGANTVEWMAEDAAGNRSEPVSQTIVVYPSIAFAETALVSGENNPVSIEVRLSCASPSYPVTLTLDAIGGTTTASADDFESLELPVELVFDSGTSKSLDLQVVDDQTLESEEVLSLQITGNNLEVNGNPVTLHLLADQSNTQLTLTDTNLAPEVSVLVTQAGVPVDVAVTTEGEVSISSEVIDANGNDNHTYVWNLAELGLVVETTEASFSFNPNNLQDGDYDFSVTVTDSGEPALSDTAEYTFTIETPPIPTAEPTAEPSTTPASNSDGGGSGSGGGGGSAGLWFLLMLGLAAGRKRAA